MVYTSNKKHRQTYMYTHDINSIFKKQLKWQLAH